MIRSLRAKLALSHTLHVVVLMPLLSLYLLYSLDGFFTQNLLQQLSYQTRLLGAQMQREDRMVTDPQVAQAFLDDVGQLIDARVLVLSRDATILASTRSEDKSRIGTHFDDPAVTQALMGKPSQGVGPGLVTEVAYVVLPLPSAEHPNGAVRLSYEINDVRAQFNQLLLLVLGGVLLTMVMGLVLGLGLATTITNPMRQLSESARQIAAGNLQARANIRSDDEVGRLAHSFNEMASRLEQAETARQRQLAAITHELARPLTGMRAAIETLRESDGDGESREWLLEGVTAEVERMQRLITTLQGLQKRALHPLALNYGEIRLEHVIRGSVAHYESLAAQRDIRLECSLPGTLPPVQADEDRLIQVMTNLLDNAFKFTRPGGVISVSVLEEDLFVRVTVADSGEGIGPDELPHIFQEFYHGSSKRLPEMHGMGLGLAICREIITAHGGSIWAETELTQGTRFTFTLPKTQ